MFPMTWHEPLPYQGWRERFSLGFRGKIGLAVKEWPHVSVSA